MYSRIMLLKSASLGPCSQLDHWMKVTTGLNWHVMVLC